MKVKADPFWDAKFPKGNEDGERVP